MIISVRCVEKSVVLYANLLFGDLILQAINQQEMYAQPVYKYLNGTKAVLNLLKKNG